MNIEEKVFGKMEQEEQKKQARIKCLSIDEFADRIGVTYLTVYWWLKDGKIKYAQPKGKRGRILIPETEVAAIFESKDRL